MVNAKYVWKSGFVRKWMNGLCVRRRRLPLLVEDVEDNVEDEEKYEEALDDERVVGEPHRVIEHARDCRSEEVPGGEGGGEEASHHGLGVGSCRQTVTDS